MISAVASTSSVRLDEVNRKIYKFQTLVFDEGMFMYCFNRV